MFVKVHKTYRNVVAVCDSELIGKNFEEGVKVLDVRDNFYRGEEKTEEEAEEIIIDMSKEDATFNIVGEKSVNLALRLGIISEEGIGTIQGVKFALVFL